MNKAGIGIRKQRNVVVLGYNMVGKTAVCLRFVNDRFDERYEPTYENSFSKIYNHKGQDIDIVIKDTQGLSDQEIFRNEYGLGYHGYVLVYSVSSMHSLEALKSINQKLMNLTGTTDVPRVLVGNKADMADENLRQVTTLQGQALADKWGIPFVECSAKFNHNIDVIFKLLLDEISKASEPDSAFTFPSGRCFDLCCGLCVSSNNAEKDNDGFGQSSSSSSLGGGLGSSGSSRSGFSYVSDNPRFETLASAVVLLTMLFGVAAILFGIVVGVKQSSHEGELLTYTLLGFGVVVFVVSVLGMIGVKQSSPEFLQVYCVSLTIILVTQIVVWIILFTNLQLFESYSLQATISSAVGAFIEVSAIILICCYQSLLTPSVDSPYLLYDRHSSLYE